MVSWKKVAVNPDYSIREVVNIIDRTALQIAVVIDESDNLLGTVTDGDVRRGLLRGLTLDEKVEEIYNKSPKYSTDETPEHISYMYMKRNFIKQMPVVDKNGRVINLLVLKDYLTKKVKKNPVVIMAGGLGSRLRPLTYDCPKPLLKIGDKPILEIILEKFIDEGFDSFFISVNYKADMIREYFGDGHKWDVSITYLHENEKLGTAGSLSLLPGNIDLPVIVMNGDLLTKVNFNHLLAFHNENKTNATMCVRDYQIQVPYGVVDIDNTEFKGIREKPVHNFFVNAGIYVLSPDVLSMIPFNQYYDMTELFNELKLRSLRSSVFPIKEYWIDIGRVQDFETANFEYGQIFSK